MSASVNDLWWGIPLVVAASVAAFIIIRGEILIRRSRKGK